VYLLVGSLLLLHQEITRLCLLTVRKKGRHNSDLQYESYMTYHRSTVQYD
jgi:hypothetical protein